MIPEAPLSIRKDPIFSPEHWDGHHKNDNCKFSRENTSPPFLKCIKPDKFASAILHDFHLLSNKQSLRSFDKGSLFDASQFNEGTVIKINYETLYHDYSRLLALKRFNQPNHYTFSYWGVTCGCDIDGKRSLFIGCYRIAANNSPYIIDWLNSSITIGEVVHKKEKNIFGETNQISRVNKIELYQIGKGVREKIPEKTPKLKLQLQTW